MKVTTADLQNPNVQAFLALLSAVEGTTTHGYATAFGGGTLHSLAAHPNVRVPYKGDTTSAAGKYQFESATWKGLVKQHGFTDFGPEAQDLGAVQLIADKGMLDAVKNGDFKTAVNGLGDVWQGLPSGTAKNQGHQSWDFVAAHSPAGAFKGMATGDAAANLAFAGTPVPVAAPIGADATAAIQPRVVVPAKARKSIDTIFDAYAKANAPAPAPQDAPPDYTAEQHQQMGQALTQDAERQRGQALASFFQEDYAHPVDLPPAIDDSINKYLAQL